MWYSLIPRPLQYRDGKPGQWTGNEAKCGIASYPGYCSTGMESWGNGLGMRLSVVRERESSTVVTYLDICIAIPSLYHACGIQ